MFGADQFSLDHVPSTESFRIVSDAVLSLFGVLWVSPISHLRLDYVENENVEDLDVSYHSIVLLY